MRAITHIRILCSSAFLAHLAISSAYADDYTPPPSPTPSIIAAIDVMIDKISSSLPRKIDDTSDFIKLRREHTNIIYTTKIRHEAQAEANELRAGIRDDPHKMEIINLSLSRVRQRLCEPTPSRFLLSGFSVTYEMYDDSGLITSSTTVLADCNK
jgi:hypothetical protein